LGLKKEDMSGVRGGMETLDNIFVNKTQISNLLFVFPLAIPLLIYVFSSFISRTTAQTKAILIN
jgi:hypothetical protein